MSLLKIFSKNLTAHIIAPTSVVAILKDSFLLLTYTFFGLVPSTSRSTAYIEAALQVDGAVTL